jgi:hypothetical protein
MKPSFWRFLGSLSFVVLGLSFLQTTAVFAAKPVVSRVEPPGLQRGADNAVVIRGARLSDAKQILFYEPGIEVVDLQVVDDASVKATLRVPATYPNGIHAFRLVSESGISNLRMFGVGQFPQVDEVEPNSTFDKPQPIQINHTVTGIVQNEDVDYFAVELAAGQKLAVELEGIRLGTEFFDPFIAILDSKRFELARSDDNPLLQQDGICSIVAPEAGKYIVEVRESSYGGNGNCQYRLHVGSFPRPLAVIPSGGAPGEQLNVTWIDATGEQWQETVALPPAEDPKFAVFAKKGDLIAASPNIFRVTALPNINEQEPNEDPATVAPSAAPVAFNGIIQAKGDVDWFTFSATKDQVFDINIYARKILRSPLDSVLEVYNAAGQAVASNDDSGGPDSYLQFRVPADGVYRVAVRDHLRGGGPFHAYRVEVKPVVPSLNLTIAELEQYVPTVISVPRGRRMAVMLNSNRANFGGDLSVELKDAPAGMTLDPLTVPAAFGTVPMMVRATPDAAVQGALADLVAKPTTGQPAIEGRIDQRTMMVRGQNNIDVWGHNAKRLAVAVTKEVPFDIQVVQPQVPLVKNGQMGLVVKAVREGEFKEPIALQLLYAPGGVAASGSVVINGDQTEATIPLTCNGGGAVGVWPIAVLAYATVGNERIVISSEYVNLEVAEPFFNFIFTKHVVEQGANAEVVVGLETKRPAEGEVEIELLGFPAGATSPAPKVKVAADATAVSFPVSVAKEARAGKFASLVCQATITRPNGVIIQTQGTGEFQIDVPLPAPTTPPPPPKPVAAAPAPMPMPAPPKVLSRLEVLRQQREAARGGKPSEGEKPAEGEKKP